MHIGLVDGQNRAFDLVAKSGKISIPLWQISGLSAHFSIKFPIVLDFDPRQIIGLALKNIGKTVQQSCALGWMYFGPFSKV